MNEGCADRQTAQLLKITPRIPRAVPVFLGAARAFGRPLPPKALRSVSTLRGPCRRCRRRGPVLSPTPTAPRAKPVQLRVERAHPTLLPRATTGVHGIVPLCVRECGRAGAPPLLVVIGTRVARTMLENGPYALGPSRLLPIDRHSRRWRLRVAARVAGSRQGGAGACGHCVVFH